MKPKEKAQTSEFTKSGKLPLADEELENVAGGMDDHEVVRPLPTVCPMCGSANLKLSSDDDNVDYMYLCGECGFKQFYHERIPPFIPPIPSPR